MGLKCHVKKIRLKLPFLTKICIYLPASFLTLNFVDLNDNPKLSAALGALSNTTHQLLKCSSICTEFAHYLKIILD